MDADNTAGNQDNVRLNQEATFLAVDKFITENNKHLKNLISLRSSIDQSILDCSKYIS